MSEILKCVPPQAIYRALADPTRREILRLLRDEDLTAGDIAAQFAISWPAVSRHLGVLANAGLVRADRRGANLVYTLTSSVLEDIATELADLARVGGRNRQPETDRQEVTR